MSHISRRDASAEPLHRPLALPSPIRRFSESQLAAVVKSYVKDRVRRYSGSEQDRSRTLEGLSVRTSEDADAEPEEHAILEENDFEAGEEEEEEEVHAPTALVKGVEMYKLNAKNIKCRVFRLDPDRGHILWDSKKSGIVAIENIKEIRTSGSTTMLLHAPHLLLQPYWLTIIYVTSLKYRTLNLIAPTRHLWNMWLSVLRILVRQRREMMGLPLFLTVDCDETDPESSDQSKTKDAWERRQNAWLKRCWKGADKRGDGTLDWDDIQALCWRLGVCSSKEDLWFLFRKADISQRDSLAFSDFRRFIALLNRRPEVEHLYHDLCREYGGTEAGFTWEVFLRFLREHQQDRRSEHELEALYRKYAYIPTSNSQSPFSLYNSEDCHTILSPDLVPAPCLDLYKHEDSHYSVNDSASNSLPVEESSSAIESLRLPLASFRSYLLSVDNGPLTESTFHPCHDMSRPLAEYYISSSHNTYLLGHQLIGDSTVEGYVRALLQGCRSVEIDIYDGDAEPIVTHGHTLTTSVPLSEVAHVIAKYAFVASPYPVIISAEIHCSLPQQDKVAEILKAKLGDKLVSAPLATQPLILEELPSPEHLKYRILFKAKNINIEEAEDGQGLKAMLDDDFSTDLSSTSDMEVQLANQAFLEDRASSFSAQEMLASDTDTHRPLSSTLSSATITSISPAKLSSTPTGTIPKFKIRMSSSLSSLLVYTVGVKYRGFNKKERYAIEHTLSLSEGTASKIIKRSTMDIIKHARNHLVRVYPSGRRVSSTNYEPNRFWAAGAQLAAINWQTYDLGYMINFAMFQRNGRCGYVTKPLALRIKNKEALDRRHHYRFVITVISAQQLPRNGEEIGNSSASNRSVMDPFVEVALHVPDWSVKNARSAVAVPVSPKQPPSRTIVVRNNGFNPVWDQTLSVPFDCVGDMFELVFVRFAVKNEGSDEPLALYCVSLASLQPGYRHLPLHDGNMSPFLFSTLFVHTAIHPDV